MAEETKLDDAVSVEIIDYLKSTPQAIAILFFAFIEGHLWTFMLSAYIRKKTKGDKLIQSIIGRTSIGLVWMTPSFIIMHYIKFASWPTDYQNILSIVIPTIVLSLTLQLVVLITLMGLGERQ